MKLALSSLMLIVLQVGVAHASNSAGPCASAAAKAARTFAAQSWSVPESALKIEVSQIMTSSNPAPIEIYGVGIRSASGTPVLFNVALKNNGNSCAIIDVSFAEYLE